MKNFRSNISNNNSDNVEDLKVVKHDNKYKSNIKEKNSKKAGFLSGLFSNKKKISEEDLYEDDNSENNTSSKIRSAKKASIFKKVQDNSSNTQQTNSNIQHTVQDVNKPIKKLMTDEESKVIYKAQLVNQTVFLYAEPRYWGQFQKYISIFDRVICLGTSDVNILEQQFRTDNISNIILLFVFNISEIEPIALFLNKLNLDSLSEGLLSIMIVRDKNINIDKLHEVPGFEKYCSVGTLNKEQISQQTLINIMGSIVKKQSPYPDVKTFDFPEKADKNLYRISNGVTGLNLDYIMSVVNKARLDSSSAVAMETLKKQLVLSQDSNIGLELMQNNVPYLKFISDMCDNNDKKIEKLRNNPRLRKEFELAISDKIALSVINTKEVKKTVSDLIAVAKEEMESVMTELETIEPEDITEWEKMNVATSEMMQKRNQMRDNIQKKYKMYLTQAKLVLSCQQIEQRICANINNLLVNTLKVDGDVISTTNISLISTITNKMKDMQEEAKKAGEDVKKELVKAFNMSNALLDESSKLIEVDDILFKSLQAEIDILSKNQNVKFSVDTRLKERATLIYNFPKSGLYSILNTTLDNQDMIVSVGKKDENDFLNIGELKISSENLIDSNLDGLLETKKLIEIQWDINDSMNTDFIITAIDYLSTYCRKVYIVINAYDESDVKVYNVEETIRTNLSRVCYFTDITKSRMLHVNYYYNVMASYSNIIVQTIAFNKFVKDNTDIDELCNIAGLKSSVKVLQIPLLPSMLKGMRPAEKVIEQLKNIIYKI